VLVALLVVMLISAAIVRALVVQHRLARLEQQRIQAFWFAESAVQRARMQLAAVPSYGGETWTIELPQESGLPGQAVIRVEPVENEPTKRKIIVEARWPNDPLDGVLEQRSLVVELTSGEGDMTEVPQARSPRRDPACMPSNV
jgi:Tfp pilus assembly protein PilX